MMLHFKEDKVNTLSYAITEQNWLMKYLQADVSVMKIVGQATSSTNLIVITGKIKLL